MRSFLLAAVFAVSTAGAALADASVAGDWHANLGGGVTINMNVSQEGKWSSETMQKSKVVRQMRGTYTQTPSNDHSGVLVFTPTEASPQSGQVETETDHYQLAQNGNQLKLTSEGDTMVFNRQKKH